MISTNMQVLMVADDTESIAAAAADIATQLNANITMVDTFDEARGLAGSAGYDAIVAADELADGRGASLIREDGPPVVIIAAAAAPDRVVAAFRAGAADVVDLRTDGAALISSLSRAASRRRRRAHTMSRNRRLRRVSSRLIRDRRELRQRVDLICQDLVHAYRRLAEKVVEGSDGRRPGKPARDAGSLNSND